MDEMRLAFESYIVNRPLCKKYGAKLTRGINGEFYNDVRVEGTGTLGKAVGCL